MGQRLVVTIQDKGEPKMKIYYHWSGYTDSAFAELEDLWYNAIKPLKKAGKSTEEILLGIIKYLETHIDMEHLMWLNRFADGKNGTKIERSCHGGIGFFNKDADPFDDKEYPNLELEFIQKLYPNETFSTDVDRNEGLVFMSPDGMEDAQKWSEGDAWIDISDEKFGNDVHWLYHGKDAFIKTNIDDRYGSLEEQDQDDEYKQELNELAQEFDDLKIYEGDGVDIFCGDCDKLAQKHWQWNEVTDNCNRFRDINDVVWEGF